MRKKLKINHCLQNFKKKNSTKKYKKMLDKTESLGVCFTLTRKVEIKNACQFHNFIHINAIQVQQIVELVGQNTMKRNTSMRNTISAV